MSALYTHRARQEQERLLAGTRWQEWELAGIHFHDRHSHGVMQRQSLSGPRETSWITEIAVPRLATPAATLLLAQGVHPRLVMETLGHCQISLSMNTYSHLIPAMREQVAVRTDEILTPVATLEDLNTLQ